MTENTRLQFSRVSFKRGKREFYFDFEIEIECITAILGPSGSGKTTLLSLLAGFEKPDTGTILLNGEDITARKPEERQMGYLFQDLALFPFLTVRDNILFGPRMHGWNRNELDSRLEALLFQLQIKDYADRKIGTLSGGELQRVALARALAPYPRLLLLDEPLSALDKSLKSSLQKTLISTAIVMRAPTLWITHDLNEAYHVAGNLILIRDGRVEQYGPKETLYWHPQTIAAATLTGDCNILEKAADHLKILRPESVRIDRQPNLDSVKATYLAEDREGAVWKSMWRVNTERWTLYRLKPLEEAYKQSQISLYYSTSDVVRVAAGGFAPEAIASAGGVAASIMA